MFCLPWFQIKFKSAYDLKLLLNELHLFMLVQVYFVLTLLFDEFDAESVPFLRP